MVDDYKWVHESVSGIWFHFISPQPRETLDRFHNEYPNTGKIRALYQNSFIIFVFLVYFSRMFGYEQGFVQTVFNCVMLRNEYQHWGWQV